MACRSSPPPDAHEGSRTVTRTHVDDRKGWPHADASRYGEGRVSTFVRQEEMDRKASSSQRVDAGETAARRAHDDTGGGWCGNGGTARRNMAGTGDANDRRHHGRERRRAPRTRSQERKTRGDLTRPRGLSGRRKPLPRLRWPTYAMRIERASRESIYISRHPSPAHMQTGGAFRHCGIFISR